MYVVRNVLICAIAVLAIIAIVFFSLNRPVTDQTASIPPVEENPPYFNVSVNGELMQGASLVEMDFTEVHPITHPELFMKYEFSHACGHAGSFQPVHAGALAMTDPQAYQKKLEESICHRCRELLEYGRQKDAAKQADGEG